MIIKGAAGVSIFFVLSGMLLSYPFWRAYFEKRPHPSIRHYVARRAARIMPGFYVALAVSFWVSSVIARNQGYTVAHSIRRLDRGRHLHVGVSLGNVLPRRAERAAVVHRLRGVLLRPSPAVHARPLRPASPRAPDRVGVLARGVRARPRGERVGDPHVRSGRRRARVAVRAARRREGLDAGLQPRRLLRPLRDGHLRGGVRRDVEGVPRRAALLGVRRRRGAWPSAASSRSSGSCATPWRWTTG